MTQAARPRNPILPADIGDRTGSAGIRRRAGAVIRRRFDALRREVLAIFSRIRVYQPNDSSQAVPESEERTLYALTATELALLARELQLAADGWIAAIDADSSRWWESFEDEAAQLGAALAVANLMRLSDAYAATRTLQQVVHADEYRERLEAAHFRSHEHWVGLAAELRAELAQIIGRAVVDGTPPPQVRAAIAVRVEAAKDQALLYALTAITVAVRDARMAEAEFAEERLGIAVGLLWASAFRRNTRRWHAARHGSTYSADEVRSFYSERGNARNCYCSTTEVLLDADRRPVLTDALRRSMAKEKASWLREHAP